MESALGPVDFAFHSMTELDRYGDSSFDLIYSGQSIEHITEGEGRRMLREAHRVLAPDGWLCLDTPNGPVWRLRSDDLMNPDHKLEYSADQLRSMLEESGFRVLEAKGLNYMGEAFTRGEFDEAEASGNPGVFAEAEACLLLAFVARKSAR